jgi:hypothetical protein
MSHKLKTLWAYSPLIGLLLSLALSLSALIKGHYMAWAVTCIWVFWFGYQLFRDTMNLYQGVGPIYWIVRDNATRKHPRFCKAVMRQVDEPYRIGSGFQVRWKTYSFQVGISHIPKDGNEYTPIMGREMTEEPEEIGQW